MFSLSTKTFGGLTAFTTVLALLVTAMQPDRIAVTLLFLAAVSFGIITAAGRMAAGHNDRAAIAGVASSPNHAPRNSYAPALVALGGGVMVLGAALGWLAFSAGAIVLAAGAMLWLSDAWREHPLSTPKASARVSDNFSLPFLMPALSLVLIAFTAIAFSFIFFSFPENRSWIVASVVAVAVFGGGFIAAFFPAKARRSQFVAFAALMLTAIALVGVIGLVRGEPEHGEKHGGTGGSEKSHSEGSKDAEAEGESHSK
jgi:hypothetical protein